jgi:ornithine cyclodeaminase/alanine dehydrogenase-like protein (mu-crystallin family)
MNLKMIDAEAVFRALPMADCIDAMADAMAAVSRGQVVSPQRIIMPLVDHTGFLAAMPGSIGVPLSYGAKVVSVHPANPAAGRPLVQGVVLLFDPATGALAAAIDGAAITALRTAAVSGLATRLLAREDARTLGVLGYGVQARMHIDAVLAVREIDRIVVWGRSLEKAEAFASEIRLAIQVDVAVADDASKAGGCDIVCAVTGASTPVLLNEHVAPGAHINLVGAHTQQTREADSALVVRARTYVDQRSAALAEAGDIVIPISEGLLSADHILAEIGELVENASYGRQHRDDITLFKSVGLVAQDLVAAHAVYRRSV